MTFRSPQDLLRRSWICLAAACCLWTSTATPATAQTRYIAFGDSITEGINFDELCTCQCPEECGYPRRLETLLNSIGLDSTILNAGKGGERTTEGVSRIETVLEAGGDVLLLMEGTNDVGSGIGPETSLFNLREMARKAGEAGVETVHATLIPRIPEAVEDADNVLNGRLARRIRQLAFEEGRRLVDPFEVFGNVPNVFETHYALYPGDPVGHPSSFGYQQLARVFFNVLRDRDVVPPVLGYVEPRDGAEEISPLTQIRLKLYDFGKGIDISTLRLFINGADVPYLGIGDAGSFEMSYLPEEPLAPLVSVRLQAQDLESPPNAVDREITRFTTSTDVPSPCVPDEITLCIDDEPGDHRFEVTMSWETALNGGQSGDAFATPLQDVGLDAGGLLSFVDGNPEVLIKVLDGCKITGFFWVFMSPTTTLGYELTVRDTLARLRGAPPELYELVLTNVDGEVARPFVDTQAYDTCEFNDPY